MRRGREAEAGATALKSRLRAVLIGKCCPVTPRRPEAGERDLNKACFTSVKSTKRPCCLGDSVFTLGLPRGSVVKNLPASAGDTGLIPGSGRSRGDRNGYSLQDSCLENSMDGAWQAPVHGIARESDITWQLNHNNNMLYGPYFI